MKTTTVALFRLQYQFAIQCFITKVKFANVTCYFETSSYSVAAVQNTQLLTTASLFVSRHKKSKLQKISSSLGHLFHLRLFSQERRNLHLQKS